MNRSIRNSSSRTGIVSAGIALGVAALLLSHGVTAAWAIDDVPEGGLSAPVPGEVTTVREQPDGTTLTIVEETSEPLLEDEHPSGAETFSQYIDTIVWVEAPEEEDEESGIADTVLRKVSGLIDKSNFTSRIPGVKASGDGFIRAASDIQSTTSDATRSVQARIKLTYTIVRPSVIRATKWEATFWRLDTQAQLVQGTVNHRNDRVPFSGSKSWNAPTSGHVYSFTPSYSTVDTSSSSHNGVFGQAALKWKVNGTTYTHYSGSVHPLG